MSSSASMLNIIIDCSGSMAESGKRLIARGICRQIEQYSRFGNAHFQIQLLAANSKVVEVDWDPDQEYPESLFECGESIASVPLLEALSEKQGKFLFLTDCAWNKKLKLAISDWSRQNAPDTCRIIKIGNEPALRILNIQVFSSEDVFVALDKWAGEH